MRQRTIPGINRPQSSANRGKELEQFLVNSGKYYLAKRIASVWKNPIEWRESSSTEFAKLFEKSPNTVAKMASGRYMRSIHSIVDFSGVVGGLAVFFDAKQTAGKSLPLANIHEHQTRFLCTQQDHGALAGFMVFFSDLDRMFFITGKYVRKCTDEALLKANRKSISLAQCEENGFEIKLNRDRIWDWVPVLLQPKETAIYAERNK